MTSKKIGRLIKAGILIFFIISEIIFCLMVFYIILSALSIVYAMHLAYPHILFCNGFQFFMGYRLYHIIYGYIYIPNITAYKTVFSGITNLKIYKNFS